MRQTIIAADFLRPGFHVALGSLVQDPFRPHQNYHPTAVPAESLIEDVLHDYQSIIHASSEVNIEALLTRFLSANIDNADSSERDLSSALAKIYTLDNSESFFETIILTDKKARTWLETTIKLKRQKAYLVVGYQTLQDASVSRSSERTRGGGGNVQLPPLAPLTGGIDTVLGTDIGDVGFQTQISKSKGNEVSFLAPGERVYAVEYRRIKFKWYHLRNINKATLQEGSYWEEGGNRGGGETAEKKLLQPVITDNLFELDDDEGKALKIDEDSESDDDESPLHVLALDENKYFVRV